MDKPISSKVVTGLLIVAVLVAFSPFLTGNTIDSANNQEATAVASAQNPDVDCWLSDGGTASGCEEESNAEKSARYADSYNYDCRGWRGWLFPSCWWAN